MEPALLTACLVDDGSDLCASPGDGDISASQGCWGQPGRGKSPILAHHQAPSQAEDVTFSRGAGLCAVVLSAERVGWLPTQGTVLVGRPCEWWPSQWPERRHLVLTSAAQSSQQTGAVSDSHRGLVRLPGSQHGVQGLLGRTWAGLSTRAWRRGPAAGGTLWRGSPIGEVGTTWHRAPLGSRLERGPCNTAIVLWGVGPMTLPSCRGAWASW